MPNILFHIPVPFDPNSKFGNDVRPLKMLQAFKDLGYDVTTISGREVERKAQINAVKKRIEAGESFDFCYSESSVPPNALLEPHRFPLRPWLDAGLFRFLKKSGIPCGIFYRDIFWKFEKLPGLKGLLRRAVLKSFHLFDLLVYKLFVPRVFLPSLEMASYVPVYPQSQFSALPPGHNGGGADAKSSLGDPIEILYVGGLGGMYDLRMFAELVSQTPGFHLTLCTRTQDWAREGKHYQEFVGEQVSVVHAGGEGLLPLYINADIATIYVQPNEYWGFAAAIKFFEYIGHHTPVLATSNTFVGNQVVRDGIGWSIPYTKSDAAEWLKQVSARPGEISERTERLVEVATEHTWQARARTAASELGRL